MSFNIITLFDSGAHRAEIPREEASATPSLPAPKRLVGHKSIQAPHL